MKNYYKIFKIKNGRVYFLKHGGAIPYPAKWLKAKIKQVYDGSNKHYYKSGFHIFDDFFLAKSYLNRYKTQDDKIILKVRAKKTRIKPTNKNVILADFIKIIQ